VISGGAALVALLLHPIPAAAEVPVFRMGLEETLEAALASSERLRAAEHDVAAARERASAMGGLLWPRVSVDASWRYVSEVPAMSLVPGRPAVDFGAHRNWSVGPAASWTVWDWGSSYLAWTAAKAAADAKAEEAALVRRQVRLSASASYAGVQMALETVRLLANSVSLAATQYADISMRLANGSASRLDVLQAHQDVFARQREYAAARTALGAALQDLFDLCGISATVWDTSFPADPATAQAPPADTPPATLVAALDPIDTSVAAVEAAAARAVPAAAHPSVASLARAADAARKASQSVLASNLPALTVAGKVTREYPNGPVLERINQNTVVLAASLPLFEGGRRMKARREQQETAAAFEERRDGAAADLARDWRKARDAVASLKVQRDADRRAASEAAELARLTYDAYRNGQARLIEVQGANLGALRARVQEARTKAEMLVQFAIIRSLAKEE